MNKEEKQAIEYFKALNELTFEPYLSILLNLINNQQKEIAELSEKLTEKICKGVEEEILEEYRQTIISKDKEIEELKKENFDTVYIQAIENYKTKISEKIKEIEKEGTKQYWTENVVKMLRELLEE